MNNQILCTRHNKPVAYICTLDKCPQNHLICETCKQQEAQHLSTHVNYIYAYNQLFTFQYGRNVNDMMPKIEKALQDCQNELYKQRQHCNNQLKRVLEDFDRMKSCFLDTEMKCRNAINETCTGDIRRFDQRVLVLRQQLREVNHQREQERGFFSLFSRNEDIQDTNTYQLIDKIIQKNKSVFKIRADLLDFNSELKRLPQKLPKYKQSARAQQRFVEMLANFQKDCLRVYGQFNELFNEEELRKSLVNEMKKSVSGVLNISGASGNTVLSVSQVSQSSSATKKSLGQKNETPPNLPLTTFPVLHPQIQTILKTLQPIPSSTTGFKDQGPFQYKEGVYYGHCSRGMRHGKGVFVFNDGVYYDGYWMNDGMYSMGRIVTKNYYYEGQINDGKAHGRGKMVDAEKQYDGQWVNDIKQGQGRMEWKNKKLKYVGTFQNNVFHGNGILECEEWRYQGGFWQGQRSGQGLLKYSNGEFFKGKFRNGTKLVGRYTYLDGSFYEGTFQQDLPHGNGVFCWPDGVKYDGTWLRGQQDGIGRQIHPERGQRKGQWVAGEWRRWM